MPGCESLPNGGARLGLVAFRAAVEALVPLSIALPYKHQVSPLLRITNAAGSLQVATHDPE